MARGWPWRRALWRWLLIGAGIYAALCLALFLTQRSLLYHPTHEASRGSLEIWSEEGEVVGYRRGGAEPERAWLMLHGNAGQAADRDYVLDLLGPGDALHVLEYPGYGARTGSPCRESIDEAAAAAWAALCRRHPRAKLGVIGESLGSGPACVLAGESRPPDKIVLVVPFDSLQRVASRHFPWLPAGRLLRDRWDNVEALRAYRGVVEIYGARDDGLIPPDHARRLAKSCEGAVYRELPAGHNDWARPDRIRIAF